MKRIMSIILLFFFIALSAQATDATYELLSAPHVKGVLRIQLAPDGKTLEYRKGSRRDEDDLDAFKVLKESMTFAVEDQFDLAFKDFNPFLLTITANSKLAADPNFTALSTFIERAEKVSGGIVRQQALFLLPRTGIGAGSGIGIGIGIGIDSPQDSMEIQIERSISETTKELGEANQNMRDISSRLQEDPTKPCTAFSKGNEKISYKTNLDEIESFLAARIITPETMKEWQSEAYGAAGVQKAKDGVDMKITEISKNVTRLSEAHDLIDKATRYIENVKSDACQDDRIKLLAQIVRIMQDLNSAKAARIDLGKALSDLSKYLAPYTDARSWRESRDRDYIFYKPESDFEHVQTVELRITTQSYSFANEAIQIQVNKPLERSIRLRRYSKAVVEAGVALAVADLNFPVYAVGVSDNGQTIVKLVKTDKNPIKAGLMLNVITRWGSDMPVHPGFQLGVTQVDDYPGFFVGVVARFTIPRPLALSAGALITWYKDLDKLVVNGPAQDAAALANDLKLRRAPAKFYFAAQYTF